jgi:hypothetical protein
LATLSGSWGTRLVAEPVALVDDRPERAGPGLPGEADRIAQAAGEDAVCAALEVELIDGGPALFDGHSVVGDVGERSDPGVEFRPVGAREQAPRPVAIGLEPDQLAPRPGDAACAPRIGESDHAISGADVERVPDERHPERLVQPVEEHVADLGDAVAVLIAQKRDAVRARTDGGGAL